MKTWKRALGVPMVLAMTLVLVGCEDVGVGLGVAYPGPYSPTGSGSTYSGSPWAGGAWAGGPVWRP